ncbi:MAG: ASCH domain-containing protein [Burkholderiales bacterium]
MKALSIRQSWAWLIVNGHKTVENRERSLGDYFGPLLIHASKGMTKADYDACVLFLQGHPELRQYVDLLPAPNALPRGGIVGKVNLTGKITNIPIEYFEPGSWYTGAVGYILRDAVVLPFEPSIGRLGFFEVEHSQ